MVFPPRERIIFPHLELAIGRIYVCYYYELVKGTVFDCHGRAARTNVCGKLGWPGLLEL